MFVPEVRIVNWRDFVGFLRRADVVVYTEFCLYESCSVEIQAYVKELGCVFKHEEPVRSVDVYLMGRKVSRKRLFAKLEEIEAKYRDETGYVSDFKKMHAEKERYARQWWRRRLRKLVRFLRELGAVEGHFTSAVMVGEVR